MSLEGLQPFDDILDFLGAVAVDAQGRETGTIKITPEYISHTAIRAEKKRTITRTKTVSISSDGSINVN